MPLSERSDEIGYPNLKSCDLLANWKSENQLTDWQLKKEMGVPAKRLTILPCCVFMAKVLYILIYKAQLISIYRDKVRQELTRFLLGIITV
jgi:hypothetical protein